MNFLILGDGPDELAWAAMIASDGEHRIGAAFPGAPSIEVAPSRDLDDALATLGIDAAIVGGPIEGRAEALRRVAAAGLAAIVLHPPGEDSEAYYVVSMSRAETGAVVVPDLPARLHPGVAAIREAIAGADPALGASRALRYESPAEPRGADLVRGAFAVAVDPIRSLIGEIEALTATGDPPGEHPTESLVVHLRGAQGRRAEVRLWSGPPEPPRLTLQAAEGSLTLEFPRAGTTEGRLIRRQGDRPEEVTTFPDWDPRRAILGVLEGAIAGRATRPDLADGTRAMEVSEGVARSLRKGRTIELHYEEISEAGTFKSVMTSSGCLVLLASLFVLPLALAGPALGIGGTIYLAYLIPPALVAFIVLQLFRFAIRERDAT